MLEHLDKNNLHHAYLIEGTREEIEPKIFKFIENLGIKTSGNPDFYHISVDSFKIEDARNLKSIEYEKSFAQGSSGKSAKKIFVISANNFLLEAQNSLLKIFEEPIENTHFFIITPNTDILLRTLVSRFYLIKTKGEFGSELKEAEKFITSPLKNRIDFIKEMLIESEDVSSKDFTKSKALKFINALETILHKRLEQKNLSDTSFFYQIFKVREFLNQPGSSVKSLMESVALIIPNF